MRSRLLLAVGSALVVLTRLAQAQGSDLAGGLRAGDYVRISGGVSIPVNPQGSLKDWSSGTALNLGWENWQNGGTGVGRVGIAINLSYSMLPLDESQFLSEFTPISGPRPTSATASNAGVFELATNFRFRIPSPLIMPTINVGLGFMNWAPAADQLHHTARHWLGEAATSIRRRVDDRWRTRAAYRRPVWAFR